MAEDELMEEVPVVVIEDEDGNEIDIEFNEEVPLKSLFNLTYPCICVNWLKSDWDRIGKNTICAIDYVELKEFKSNA